MHFLRRSALVLAAGVFTLTLAWFGITFGIERVFGTPNAIKHALKTSGVYNSIIGDALDQAQKQVKTEQSSGQDSPDIPVDDPNLRQIINQSFPPEYLQEQTERALDGIYNWLRGDTPGLEFNIDVADTKTRLADGLASYATQRLNSLPACSSGPTGSEGLDAFRATCLPRGVDVTTVGNEARKKILGEEFLKDTQINAQTVKVDGDQTIDQKFSQVPGIYQKIQKGIYGLGLLAVLSGLGVLFLSDSRRSGARKLSITGLSVGFPLAFVGWFAGFASGKAVEKFAASPEGKEPLQQTAVQIVQMLANDLRTWWLGFGLALIVGGIAGLVALHFTKHKQYAPETPVSDPDQTPASEAKNDAKPKVPSRGS